MEIKKSPEADLENRKGMFFLIGMAGSLALVILMFSMSQNEKKYTREDGPEEAITEEMVEVTHQEEPPTPPTPRATVAVFSDVINIVRNDTQIADPLNLFDDEAEVGPVAQLGRRGGPIEGPADPDEAFISVEKDATFMGKPLTYFSQWIRQNKLVYPRLAQENNITGKVVIEFVVERDGSVGRVKSLSPNVDRSLQDAAIKAVQSSPKWTPAEQRGRIVAQKFTLPVIFQLQE